MHILEQLLTQFGLARSASPSLPVDEQLWAFLTQLAEDEHRPVEQVAQDLLYLAIHTRQTAAASLQLWETLTPREKQAAALTCLGYTNQEIAGMMIISTNTVKTYMRHILRKFDIHSKEELRTALAEWDFSEWQPPDTAVDDHLTPTNSTPPGGVTP